MRQIAAYADAVATGAVKSPRQLRSVGGECANDPDAYGITLNQTVFDEWKLGPFDTEPVVSNGPDPAVAADVETFVTAAMASDTTKKTIKDTWQANNGCST